MQGVRLPTKAARSASLRAALAIILESTSRLLALNDRLLTQVFQAAVVTIRELLGVAELRFAGVPAIVNAFGQGRPAAGALAMLVPLRDHGV